MRLLLRVGDRVGVRFGEMQTAEALVASPGDDVGLDAAFGERALQIAYAHIAIDVADDQGEVDLGVVFAHVPFGAAFVLRGLALLGFRALEGKNHSQTCYFSDLSMTP